MAAPMSPVHSEWRPRAFSRRSRFTWAAAFALTGDERWLDLSQRACLPGQLTACERQLAGHQIAERGDDPGRSVTPLYADLLGGLWRIDPR
jgi:hypothetical protein